MYLLTVEWMSLSQTEAVQSQEPEGQNPDLKLMAKPGTDL